MATVYGVNATLINSPSHQNMLSPDEQGGRIHWIHDSYECASTASGADIVLGGKVPQSAQILPGSRVYFDALGTANETIAIGTTISGVDLAPNTTSVSSAGSVVLNNTVDLFGTKSSGFLNVHVTPKVSGTLTGTVRLSLLYATV
jgi:hypothetical protein